MPHPRDVTYIYPLVDKQGRTSQEIEYFILQIKKYTEGGEKKKHKTTIKYYIALKFCKVFIKAQCISLITTGGRQMSSEVKKGLKGKAFSRPVYRRNKADVYVMCLTVCGGE